MNGGSLNTVNVNVSTGKCLQNSAISNSGRLLYVKFFLLVSLTKWDHNSFFFYLNHISFYFHNCTKKSVSVFAYWSRKSSMYNYLNGITLKVTCKEHRTAKKKNDNFRYDFSDSKTIIGLRKRLKNIF